MDLNGEFFTSRDELFNHLDKESDVFRDPRIRKAFQEINRADFVEPDYHVESYEDYPLPIGHGQTISQPTTVAFMLELLGAKEGENVLDVGSGSGWTTALLASIVGEKGTVVGVELVPELVEQGKKNLTKYSFNHAKITQAGKTYGFPKGGPYDRILVSASAEELPGALIEQLDIDGVMVIPIKDSIWHIQKTADDDIESKEYPGFTFVPLK